MFRNEIGLDGDFEIDISISWAVIELGTITVQEILDILKIANEQIGYIVHEYLGIRNLGAMWMSRIQAQCGTNPDTKSIENNHVKIIVHCVLMRL